jgi:hypothetical protein
MRRPHLFWLAALALGLGACASAKAPRLDTLDTAAACADWRWIGISQPDAQCPGVTGWTGRPMFPQLAPPPPECSQNPLAPRAPAAKVLRELNRFCVYERANAHGRKPFPTAGSMGLVRVDQDCAALSVSGVSGVSAGPNLAATIKASIKGPQTEDFFAQAGKPRVPLKIDNWLGVRLAFLDTEPTRVGVPETMGNSAHGYILSHIARQLVCTPEPIDHCAVQIATRLALPIQKFDPRSLSRTRIDREQGGVIGTQGDLAEAIRNEVDAWRSAKAQQHLVLNLSVAWDGRLFGGLDEAQIAEMRAGTQAVYRALEYAAGYDVLVLAAAGNQKREPCEGTGALLPAAWESGGRETCGGSPRPLIYAVGGVDSGGNPLLNSRPGGMPKRSAFGEVKDWKFSGSSISTAVVSSTAALVWDSFPDLDSHGVMEILDGGGEDLSYPPDFWFGSAAPPVAPFPQARRVSLCATLRAACDRHPDKPCPLRAACERWSPSQADLTRPATEILGLGSCQPWLATQPEDDPCLACIKPPPGR